MNGTVESNHAASQVALRALRRRAGLIIACLILTPAAAYAFSVSQQKQYSTSASLLFRDPGFDQKLFGSTLLPPSQDPNREAATNVRLVSLEAVAARTAKRLHRLNGVEVQKKVTASAEGQSNVVSVTATDPNPRFASALANTFADQYIQFRRDADRSKIREAERLIRSNLANLPQGQQNSVPGGQQSSTRARELLGQLDVLGSLQTGNAELVQRAELPKIPSSPRPILNTALGAFVGLLLGLGLTFVLERMDRRVRDPRELEEIFERPILGGVPESRALARSGTPRTKASAGESEAFRMLRANLRYFDIDRDIASVLVTSAAPGDGKTTISWNLASAAAGAGERVLLVEADLRHPALAEGFGLRSAAGLSTVLAGEAELEQAVQQIPVQERANGQGLRTVDVLLAGPLPPNPSDLLESDRMRELIARAEHKYDFVVIDTPPTSVVSDAIPLVPQVGGVIVVGRLAKTTKDAALHLKAQLRNLDARVLGVVVNAVGESDAYGYGYGYGYGVDDSRGNGESRSPVIGGRGRKR